METSNIEEIKYDIVPFKLEHAQQIIDIRKTELSKEIGEDFPNETAQKLINELSIEKFEEISKEANRIIFTAILHTGKVAGCGCIVDNQIRLVFIHEDFQRFGIGSKMIHKLIEIAQEKKYNSVNLFCHKNAVVFYEKLGFTKKGFENSPRLGRVDVMEKILQ